VYLVQVSLLLIFQQGLGHFFRLAGMTNIILYLGLKLTILYMSSKVKSIPLKQTKEVAYKIIFFFYYLLDLRAVLHVLGFFYVWKKKIYKVERENTMVAKK
jgi:hypothetical protein